MPGAGSSTGHVGFGWDDCVGCSLSVPMSPCSCVQLCPLGIVTREGVFYIRSQEICNWGLKTSENSKVSLTDFIKSPNESHGKTIFGIILLSDKLCFPGRMVNHL